MTQATRTKEEKIKKLVREMLDESRNAMDKKLESIFLSGCIDVETWDEKNAPMILPKTIIIALLESESTQYDGAGTRYEKQIKKDVRNIRYFI